MTSEMNVIPRGKSQLSNSFPWKEIFKAAKKFPRDERRFYEVDVVVAAAAVVLNALAGKMETCI